MSHVADADSTDLEALFDSIAAASRPRPSAPAAEPHLPDVRPADNVVEQVGHLTRRLHETLREMGLDRAVENAAQTIPDARQRLAYVAAKTEEAAMRCLNAIDAAKPLQAELEEGASALATEWDKVFDGTLQADRFRDLAQRTRTYLQRVPRQTGATQTQLTEIMMAQDFQDLTGQVVKKLSAMVEQLERDLIGLLVANVSAEKRHAAQSAGLLEGPVVGGARSDVVTSQSQVDELLESLGF
jgi:chemotaxis protein CheZ